MTQDSTEDGQTDSAAAGDRTQAWSFETKQIHAGAAPDPTTGARATPIYQTTSYVFRDTKHAADLFALAELGNIYSRIMNPTQDVLEQRVAALEGGVAAVAFSSGQAAETLSLLNILGAGDHFVSSASLYGGTYNLFHYTLPKLGIEVSFVDDPDDLAAWAAAVRPNTKAFYAETLGNPRNNVLNVRGVADATHAAGVPLLVDNTVPDARTCCARSSSAPTSSSTRRRSSWAVTARRSAGSSWTPATSTGRRTPRSSRASTSPTRATTASTFGPALGNIAFAIKLRVQGLRDVGAAIAPQNAFLIIQGIETLSLRIERHVQNAQHIAEWLEARDEVATVHYAGLPELPLVLRGPGVPAPRRRRDRRVRAARRGRGGQGLRRESGAVQPPREHRRRPQPGHPPGVSTTHSQLSAEEQLASGVTPGLVRLSVGLENVEDLLADLDAGLRAVKAHV